MTRYFAELNASAVVQRVIVANDDDPTEWHLGAIGGWWAEGFRAGVFPKVGDTFTPYRTLRFGGSTPTASMAPSPSGGDDTAALQAWLDGLADGALARLQPSASYAVSGSILLESRNYLDIDGNGSTLTASSTAEEDAQILLLACTGIRIRNLTIQGENPDPGFNGAGAAGHEGRHGISIRTCDDVWVDSCTIRYTYADFVYIGVASTQTTVWPNNIRVTNCTFTSNGRMGVAIVAGFNVLIDNCTFNDCRRAGIDIEPNSVLGGARFLTVSNCAFGMVRLYNIACEGYGGDCAHIYVTDCTTTAEDGFNVTVNPPVGAQRRGPLYFLRNNVQGASVGTPGGATWQFVECDGVVIRDNVVALSDDTVLAGFTDCTDYTVAGNTITGGVGDWYDETGTY